MPLQHYPRVRDSLRRRRIRTTRRLRISSGCSANFRRCRSGWCDTANDAPNGKVGSLEILAREAQLRRAAGERWRHPGGARLSGARDRPAGRRRRGSGDVPVPRARLLARGEGGSAGNRHGVRAQRAGGAAALVERLRAGLHHGVSAARTRSNRRIFAAIREYLADDYQLGARIAALGKRVAMADTCRRNESGRRRPGRNVWKHQVRWSRTIRVSRPAGYFGYLVTQATFWCVPGRAYRVSVVALAGITVRLFAAAAGLRAARCASSRFRSSMHCARSVRLCGLVRRAVRECSGVAGRAVSTAADGRIVCWFRPFTIPANISARRASVIAPWEAWRRPCRS